MIKVLRRCLATQAVAVAVALRRRPSSQRSASPPSQARIDYMRSIVTAVPKSSICSLLCKRGCLRSDVVLRCTPTTAGKRSDKLLQHTGG